MLHQQETQTWQEMMETLQEVQNIQELQSLNNEMGGNTHRGQVVVIRIQLMPSSGPVFGHPTKVLGAVNTSKSPVSGRTIVPVREVNTLTGELSQGIVYAPNVGSNEFEFSFLGRNALQKAGGWLGRQLTRMPQIAQRIRGVKALIGGGKPCPGCDQQFAKQVSGAVPAGRKFNLQIRRNPNGRWNAGINYQDAQGRDINLTGNGLGRDMNFALQGQGANGQAFNANFDRNNGNTAFDGNYQDPNGNNVTASAHHQAGQWDVNADGTIRGNNFGVEAAGDGSNYNGYGYLQNNGGQNFYGGAVSGGPGQFQGVGAIRTPNMTANANVNMMGQEMEASVLGEVFREAGL